MQGVTFILAGIIGGGVAVIHGLLVERLMIKPHNKRFTTADRTPVSKLVPVLLHFSTFNWFFGGAALVAAAIWFEQEAKLATGMLVGSSYLYGAVANFWATRGRH